MASDYKIEPILIDSKINVSKIERGVMRTISVGKRWGWATATIGEVTVRGRAVRLIMRAQD